MSADDSSNRKLANIACASDEPDDRPLLEPPRAPHVSDAPSPSPAPPASGVVARKPDTDESRGSPTPAAPPPEPPREPAPEPTERPSADRTTFLRWFSSDNLRIADSGDVNEDVVTLEVAMDD
jgi:hypothetical protein